MESLRRFAISILSTVLCLCVVTSLKSQTITITPAASESVPVYDVMSIRQNKSASQSSSVDGTDARYSATNVSLKYLLAKIFAVKENLIFGIPTSIDSARFDIDAKVVNPDPEAMKKITNEQSRSMLLPILAERFQLKTHTETMLLPVYNLVVSGSGPKFNHSTDDAAPGRGIGLRGRGGNYQLNARAVSMASLTKALGDQVHRPVIDKTGLTGNYDFLLNWSGDDSVEAQGDSSPSIFTALQEQLGLKLEATKGPVDTLVVDHAEMPSGN